MADVTITMPALAPGMAPGNEAAIRTFQAGYNVHLAIPNGWTQLATDGVYGPASQYACQYLVQPSYFLPTPHTTTCGQLTWEALLASR